MPMVPGELPDERESASGASLAEAGAFDFFWPKSHPCFSMV